MQSHIIIDTAGKVADNDFEKLYLGIRDYDSDATTGKVWATGAKESTVADNLIMHSNHGSRHVGMKEALRGLLVRLALYLYKSKFGRPTLSYERHQQ